MSEHSPRPGSEKEKTAVEGRGEAVAALAGGLAHDLNNVLSAVLMTVDLLEGVCTRERERNVLDAIEESAWRGVVLTRRLLLLSRGEDEAPSDGAEAMRRAAGEPAPLPPDPSPEEEPLILVVDGDGAVREAISGVLEKHGYRVQTAGDGAEAVVLFARDAQAVAAVVAAADLPYLDGPGVLGTIRRWRDGVPAVLTGGDGAGGDAEDPAAPVLLGKPFTAPELLAALRQAMGG
jgi:CheY-like chemotaxis protein